LNQGYEETLVEKVVEVVVQSWRHRKERQRDYLFVELTREELVDVPQDEEAKGALRNVTAVEGEGMTYGMKHQIWDRKPLKCQDMGAAKEVDV